MFGLTGGGTPPYPVSTASHSVSAEPGVPAPQIPGRIKRGECFDRRVVGLAGRVEVTALGQEHRLILKCLCP